MTCTHHHLALPWYGYVTYKKPHLHGREWNATFKRLILHHHPQQLVQSKD